MYRYILFDIDGTIFDTGEGITKSVAYALGCHGIPVDNPESLRCFVGPPLSEMFAEKYGIGDDRFPDMLRAFRERYQTKGIYELAPYPGADRMLEALRRSGCRLLIATSKPEPMARKILEDFHLIQYFDEVCGSTLDERRTGKQEVIEELCRRIHLPEEEKGLCVMVGDRKYDARGAAACGISAFIGVSYGYAEPGELEGEAPVFIADSTEALARYLLRQ